jgi:hypothetical protein
MPASYGCGLILYRSSYLWVYSDTLLGWDCPWEQIYINRTTNLTVTDQGINYGPQEYFALHYSTLYHLSYTNMSSSQVYLKKARYGKDKVKVMKVYRDGKWQTCVELTVSTRRVFKFTELLTVYLSWWSIGCPYLGGRHRDQLHWGWQLCCCHHW